jgi:SNF2 family DNA or RNA helicase
VKSLAPFDTSRFKLSLKHPTTGVIAQGSADRPWCVHVQAAAGGYKLGGKIGNSFVRDMLPNEVVDEIRSSLPTREKYWNGVVCEAHPIPVVIDGFELDPYQLDTAVRIQAGGGVMALGCGLGKTLTAVAAALLRTPKIANPVEGKPEYSTLLIVCPLNAIPTWKPMVPWLRTHFEQVLISSQDSLHKLKGLNPSDSSCVIFDEAHGFGAWSAQRTKLAHFIRWQFTIGICLTGTLLHAGPEKVLSILDLAVPGAALFSNKYEFGRKFECLVSKMIGARSVIAVERVPKSMHEEFQNYLDTIVVCKNKHSPDVVQSITIPDQMIVSEITGDVSRSLTDESVQVAREMLAEDPNAIPSMAGVMHQLSHAGTNDKVEWLLQKLEVSNDPYVVFATYHETLDAIENGLRNEAITFVRVDGGVTGKNRGEMIEAFKSGRVRVFLAQTDAASVSMNLQNARTSVMFDSTWKAATYEQALARTCRRGQTHACTHYNLIGNKFQREVFKRVMSACDFDSQLAEYQEIQRAIK